MKLFLQNIVNGIFWISFFGMLNLGLTLLIVTILVMVLKNHNVDKFWLKTKVFAFLTLTLSSLLPVFAVFVGSNQLLIFLMLVLTTLLILATIYFAILMLIVSISECKAIFLA